MCIGLMLRVVTKPFFFLVAWSYAQMNAADSPFRESAPTLSEMFETGGAAKGMPVDAIDELPVMRFTEHTVVDAASGERIGCCVCLQVCTPPPYASRAALAYLT